jgi:hypothetical protein
MAEGLTRPIETRSRPELPFHEAAAGLPSIRQL